MEEFKITAKKRRREDGRWQLEMQSNRTNERVKISCVREEELSPILKIIKEIAKGNGGRVVYKTEK